MKLKILSIGIIAFLGFASSAKILGLFTSYGKSHQVIYIAVVKALVERGHNVTVVTTIPITENNPGYRHIKLPKADFRGMTNQVVNAGSTLEQFKHFIGTVTSFMDAAASSIKEPQMIKLMEEETFDLVLFGYYFNEFQMGVAEHFKCPIVVIWRLQPHYVINTMVGNPFQTSYVPNVFWGSKGIPNFFERVQNYFIHGVESILWVFVRQLYIKHYDALFPSDKYPSFDDMRRNVSLVLCSHHFSEGPIQANVPGIIEIGGIQIKEKPDPLSQDIKEFLDTATNGAIFFSLGSNAHSTDLRPETIQIIYNVLSSLKQKVLWKWESDKYPGNAKNIFFNSWLPQDDILAHPNIHLFITHGGKGSVVESEYHGIPMVGLPIFGDQPMNVKEFVADGFGIGLDYQTITEDTFKAAIIEVLENPKYRENVKRYSNLYRDRPMTARETATYWIEYVIRHHGAKHLQSPAVHMTSIQLMGLDVIAFLVVVVYVSFKVTILIFKFLWRKCCGGGKKEKVTKKKTKKQ